MTALTLQPIPSTHPQSRPVIVGSLNLDCTTTDPADNNTGSLVFDFTNFGTCLGKDCGDEVAQEFNDQLDELESTVSDEYTECKANLFVQKGDSGAIENSVSIFVCLMTGFAMWLQ